MISKRVKGRKDGRSSAADALRYGEGLDAGRDKEAGEVLDKSHRTRFGNFGLLDDGVYAGRGTAEMAALIELAGLEMQACCDLNTRVGEDKKLAHFVISYNQDRPGEAILLDTEDSMLAEMGLDRNHFATFLHNDNGYWHLHIFASRVEKDYPHRCNPLWRDQKKRDHVCRQIELRHGLSRDAGLHEIDANGQIVEVPLIERKARREAKPKTSDRAQVVERYSGEKTFQTWCLEIRIGDRLKHAKSWQDLHTMAAAYNCEIRTKGAGFVVCPIGEKGGITLSSVGLKNLPAKFGIFQPAQPGHVIEAEKIYAPEPTKLAGSLYQGWLKEKNEYYGLRNNALNELRTMHATARSELRSRQRGELAEIRTTSSGQERAVAISVAKLKHAVDLTELAAAHAAERQQTRQQFSENCNPGATFRDYLVREAGKGNDAALALARQYGASEATAISKEREAQRLNVVAAAAGLLDRPTPRLSFTHQVGRNGTVIFDLGRGRKVIDSAISRQVQLNGAAAVDPAAVEASLRFAMAKFGSKLTLTGPEAFQMLAVETAVQKGLHITFLDPALDSYRQKLQAERRTPQFVQTAPTRERTHERAQPHRRIQPPRQIPPAHRRDRLYYLSERDLVLDTSRNVLPLWKDVSGGVEQSQQKKPNHRMQRKAAGTDGVTSQLPNLMASPQMDARLDAKEKAYSMLVESIKQRGGSIYEIKDGVPYAGTIELSADGYFAIQRQGRGAVVIHDRLKLNGPLAGGQYAEITYRGGIGRGRIQIEPEHTPSRSPLGR